MTKLLKANIWYLIGGAIGGLAGFLYWQQVGCASGTCAITSHPVNSALYGAVLGMLFTDLFKK